MPDALKDLFFKAAFFDELCAALETTRPGFDRAAFMARIYDSEWPNQPLKARVRHITSALHEVLPADYRAALAVLRQVEPQVRQPDFALMVFSDYVAAYGLDDWEASLSALEQFTQRMSAEFAVRPFIARDQPRMLAQMLRWAQHPHPGVRRLATEGGRPRLPWGIALPALQADPTPILPILDRLRNDPSESVRLSVSNHLNDISKDHPQLVIAIVRRWLAEATPEVHGIVSHALRTLVKQGHREALELLGFGGSTHFVVKNVRVEPAVVPIGGHTVLSFEVESLSDTPQRLMIDYVVHHQRADGRLTPKVFKLTTRDLVPGDTVAISKRHSFKPVSTRRYYPGTHAIEVQINGSRCGRCELVVTE